MIWFNEANGLYYRANPYLNTVECSRGRKKWARSAYSYVEFIEAMKKGQRLIPQVQHESLENK